MRQRFGRLLPGYRAVERRGSVEPALLHRHDAEMSRLRARDRPLALWVRLLRARGRDDAPRLGNAPRFASEARRLDRKGRYPDRPVGAYSIGARGYYVCEHLISPIFRTLKKEMRIAASAFGILAQAYSWQDSTALLASQMEDSAKRRSVIQ